MEPKTTLQFTNKELEVLNVALGELPFKMVASLVYSINTQLTEARRDSEARKENASSTGHF